jgi:hypothetical protein
MRTIFSLLARFFLSLASFFQGMAEPAHPFPPKSMAENKKDRLNSLLAKDELSAEEQKELSCLVAEFEGGVIFLNSFRERTEAR